MRELAPLVAKVAELLRAGKSSADEKPVSVFPTSQTLREVLLPLLEWCVASTALPFFP